MPLIAWRGGGTNFLAVIVGAWHCARTMDDRRGQLTAEIGAFHDARDRLAFHVPKEPR